MRHAEPKDYKSTFPSLTAEAACLCLSGPVRYRTSQRGTNAAARSDGPSDGATKKQFRPAMRPPKLFTGRNTKSTGIFSAPNDESTGTTRSSDCIHPAHLATDSPFGHQHSFSSYPLSACSEHRPPSSFDSFRPADSIYAAPGSPRPTHSEHTTSSRPSSYSTARSKPQSPQSAGPGSKKCYPSPSQSKPPRHSETDVPAHPLNLPPEQIRELLLEARRQHHCSHHPGGRQAGDDRI